MLPISFPIKKPSNEGFLIGNESNNPCINNILNKYFEVTSFKKNFTMIFKNKTAYLYVY